MPGGVPRKAMAPRVDSVAFRRGMAYEMMEGGKQRRKRKKVPTEDINAVEESRRKVGKRVARYAPE